MSERDLRRRIRANRRSTSRARATRSSPSPSPVTRRRSKPAADGQLSKQLKEVKVLKRSKSEPLLRHAGEESEVLTAESSAPATEEEDGVLYRPLTCTDIFTAPESLVSTNLQKCPEVYNKDAKVVVNVTVEGSPGPIRTMLKLGSNVDDTIRLVVNKYNEEGRTPRLDKHSASKCELHQSYFSLKSLSKSDLIGDVGSRSFYLRKYSSVHSDNSGADNISRSNASSNQLVIHSATSFLPTFLDREIKKIIRRTRKFWTFFGCIPCVG